jgi:hypothetical protein
MRQKTYMWIKWGTKLILPPISWNSFDHQFWWSNEFHAQLLFCCLFQCIVPSLLSNECVYIYIILFILKKLSQLSNLMNFTLILIFSPKFSPLYGYPWFRDEWILHALRILDIMFLKSPKEAVVFQRPELMKRSPVSFPTLRQNSE